MVKRRWQLGLGGLGLGQVAMAKPRKRYVGDLGRRVEKAGVEKSRPKGT